jgi:hypothetical protein
MYSTQHMAVVLRHAAVLPFNWESMSKGLSDSAHPADCHLSLEHAVLQVKGLVALQESTQRMIRRRHHWPSSPLQQT